MDGGWGGRWLKYTLQRSRKMFLVGGHIVLYAGNFNTYILKWN